jgi:16S rRNA processing protein RimM
MKPATILHWISLIALCKAYMYHRSATSYDLLSHRSRIGSSDARVRCAMLRMYTDCSDKKIKINKYEQYSKVTLDPVQSLLQRVTVVEKSSRDLLSIKTIGTTIIVPGDRPPPPPASILTETQLKWQRPAVEIDPLDPSTFGFCHIGVVTKPRGLKGEVVAKLDSSFGHQFFQSNKFVYLKRPDRAAPRPIQITQARQQSDDRQFIVFRNMESRTIAETLRRYEIYVRNVDKYNLTDDEYLVGDLIGMTCLLKERNTVDRLRMIGRIKNVFTPEQLCGRRKRCVEIMHGLVEVQDHLSGNLFLIPFVDELVCEVNAVAREMIFQNIPESLIEATYKEKKKSVVIRGYLPSPIKQLQTQMHFVAV